MKGFKIFSAVVMAILITLSLFFTAGALAQTPTPTPTPPPRGDTLTTKETRNVINALQVLKLTRPTEVGDGKPDDLVDKLAKNKVRSMPRNDQDEDPNNDLNGNDGAAYPNDRPGVEGGDIYLVKDFLNDTRFPERDLDLKSPGDLLKLSLEEFTVLVDAAELVLHEYTHTQQKEKQKDASDEQYKSCGPDSIEMEAYWAGILYKLDLKVQLLANCTGSLADRYKLDALDSLILGALEVIEQPRQVAGLTEDKTYEGNGNNGTARKAIDGNITIDIDKEPENISTAQERANAAKVQKDNAKRNLENLGSGIDLKRKESKQGLIYPGMGGSIELPSGSAWVVVPPGSLPGPAEIEIHRMDLLGLPKGANALSPVYELGPGQISLDPAKPARLYIRIDNPALIEDAHLCRWDSYLFGLGYDGWQEILDGREVDEHQGVISVEVDHFSYYMVIGVELPTITSITPDHGNQGETLDVIITGTNFAGATGVSFGAGITVNSFNVDFSTQITANISINADAATGARDISVTTLGGTDILVDGFTVEKGGICFIATAAYGTPMAKEIEILREFRDQYLLTNPVGEALVELYYNTSPPIANFITEHPALKPVVRAALKPVIFMSSVAVNTTLVEKIAIVGLMALAVLLVVWLRKRAGKARGSAN
jgi:hypothetical protein